MFRLGQSNQFSYPVNVEIVGDNGARKTHTFTGIFKRIDRDEFDGIVDQVRSGDMKDRDVVDRVLLGWKDVQDADGNDLPYDETGKAELFSVLPVVPAIASAFLEANTPKGRAKN
ncbi:MAG: hypothetical protein IPG66_05920 [Hydrogenophilales bacterium]|nr:hypothetical protein [Hydrogenophilales bacterium]